jgi:hypothetical protein
MSYFTTSFTPSDFTSKRIHEWGSLSGASCLNSDRSPLAKQWHIKQPVQQHIERSTIAGRVSSSVF